MRPSTYILVFWYSYLVAGTPHSLRQDIDPDNPSASDPKTPPSSLKAPLRPFDNPFAKGLTAVPESCTDFQNPSDECLQALVSQDGNVIAFSGGELKFDDKSCNIDQERKLETAAWDAMTLANFAGFSAPPKSSRDIIAWKTYIGPDYQQQQQRIADNLNRVNDFKAGKKFDIITSCKDTKKYCDLKVEGKKVGGYAWTYSGYFGYQYYYITLCPVFFTLSNLEEKTIEIENAMQRGELRYAQEGEWQKNSGQFFLHEMMHLNSTGKPHIIDEKSDPTGIGPRAYGSRLVYKLAQRPLKDGGGATRASTNADSYAWLVNMLFFWDLTGYFPKPDEYKGVRSDPTSSGDELIFQMDFGTLSGFTSEEVLQSRLVDNLAAMQTPVPPAVVPPNDIPAPNCASDGISFPQPPVENFIDEFCNQKQFWNTVIGPLVSTGTGQTSDGRNKALGVSQDYSLDGTSDKLWLGLMFSRDTCTGSFQFTSGQSDQEKLDHCKDRFRTVLNGCQTNTITEKKGGDVNDSCAIYTITTQTSDKDPFADWQKDQGDFTCTETDTSAIGGQSSPLYGTCTCWYSGYPGLTDIFKMPASHDCKDTNKAELLNG